MKESIRSIFSRKSKLRFKYAVFGLGNSSYEFFNQFAKDLSLFLNRADAQEIIETHLVDENLGYLREHFSNFLSIEKGYEEWVENFLKHPDVLRDGDVRPTNFLTPIPCVKIKYGKPTTTLCFSATHSGTIEAITKISKEGGRNFFKCEINSPDVQVFSGDHLLIFPENNSKLVLRLAKRLRVNELLDLEVQVENTPKGKERSI